MKHRIPSPSPLLAVCYLRVSTSDQDLGPDAQRAAIARWADAHGVRLVGEFEDRLTGGSGERELPDEAIARRPGLMAAIAALGERGAGVLVVAKRDRLARDTLVSAMLERLVARQGAKIVSAAGEGTAGDGPADVLLRRVVDAFAEYERLLIKARTRAALGVKRSRRELVGSVPYGSRLSADGVTLEADMAEQGVIARARGLRAEGWTLRAIGIRLEAMGLLPRGGGRWHPPMIARMVAV